MKRDELFQAQRGVTRAHHLDHLARRAPLQLERRLRQARVDHRRALGDGRDERRLEAEKAEYWYGAVAPDTLRLIDPLLPP